ncbi:ATP-binding protein [Streptomyces yunnanensis]|uniref:ATP-binding protein n=1 Tax=Streptomyces yunnanensis TaxID=156453 RepID=A0ABY8AD22_9ACTN|nr:ATP-binding protein [Streptomyces yunnanensis]WEB41412.1 ATP-binding protein [Streptomyces yunnanensis]
MRHCVPVGRFPVQSIGASIPWRGAKEVSGVALVVAQEVPTSSIMAVPHGPAGVGMARRRMREELSARGVQDSVVDDAILVLSELLSNACRHARPIYEDRSPDSVSSRSLSSDSAAGHASDGASDGARQSASGGPFAAVRASWRIDGQGRLIVAVTDGGGPTRPIPATPSVTARGGRGLAIIRSLAKDWGVRDTVPGEVTVWAALSLQGAFATRVDLTTDRTAGLATDRTSELAAGRPLSLRKDPRTGAVRPAPTRRGPARGTSSGLAFAELDELP